MAPYVVASLSSATASGAILATSAVAVRNIVGVRRIAPADGTHDPLLRWTRLAMLPIVVAGTAIALNVAQTGILLTLAFDLMLACLAIPFLLGVFWKRGGTTAALAAMTTGLVVRFGLFLLTPTIYGVPNDIAYIPNDLVPATFDGWPTIYGAIVSIVTYVVVALVRPAAPTAPTSTRDPEEEMEPAAV
jgi:SSS family solute:Na+ symporter